MFSQLIENVYGYIYHKEKRQKLHTILVPVNITSIKNKQDCEG